MVTADPLDYIDQHITLDLPDQRLLGTVALAETDLTVPGGVRLTVRHFNGEYWPVEPSAHLVNVLVRTYDDGEGNEMAALGPGYEDDRVDPYAPPSASDLRDYDAQLDLDLEDVAEFEAWLDSLAGVDDPAYDAWADARDAAYKAAMEATDGD